MFKTKTDYEVQRIIDEVASRHKLFLKPDDAAFALITMNRLIFHESLDTAVGIIRQHLEAWERACDRVRASTDEAIKSQVRLAGEEIRSSIAGDLSRAKFESSYLVDKVYKSYAQKSRWTEIRIRALMASITCASTLLIVYITEHFTHHQKEQPPHVIEQHVNPTPQPAPNTHNVGAAAVLRCSKAHLSNVLNGYVSGLPPLPYVSVGRRKLIRRESLDQWLGLVESRTVRKRNLAALNELGPEDANRIQTEAAG